MAAEPDAAVDNLYPIAILIDELKNDDVQLRLHAMKEVQTIAIALGPERTRTELVPFLGESVEDEDEVLLALAEQLGSFVPLIGGPAHAHVLLPALEELAKAEEATVRDKAVSSLHLVASQMPSSDVPAHLWPLVQRCGARDWYAAKVSATHLLPRVYASLPVAAAASASGGGRMDADSKVDDDTADAGGAAAAAAAAAGSSGRKIKTDDEEDGGSSGGAAPAVTREDVLALYSRLAGDDSPLVRRAVCSVMPALGTALAGGALPVPPTAPRPAAAGGPVEPATAGAASTAAARGMVADTGAVVAGSSSSGAAAAAAGGAGTASSSSSSSSSASGGDGFNVDTGDPTTAAIPPPVPPAITVAAADEASGALAAAALLPVLGALARDDQDSVRLLSVDACVALARLTNGGMASLTGGVVGSPSAASAAATTSDAAAAVLARNVDLRESLTKTALALAGDRSWRIRWSFANRVSELADALGVAITRERLLPAFDELLADPEAEVRTFAAYRVADIGRIVGGDITIARLLPVVTRLSEDAAEPVRAALASVILALAPLLGQAATVDLLLPVFLRLLKDSSAQVRLNIISKLEAVNAVIGLRILSQSLLPAISELSSDKQWRVRAAIIDFMPLLAKQLGADFFDSELTGLCIKWLSDPVAAIREAAANNLRELTRVFGSAWAATTLVPRVTTLSDGSYALRMTSLIAAVTLAEALDAPTLASSLLPFILGFARDPVPNIRFNLAKACERLAPRLDAATRATVVKPVVMALAASTEEADVQFFASKALAVM